MPYDDEMQVSLHPRMAAWLQNELENGRFEVAEEGDDKILDDTLKQIQPAPEPSKEEMAVTVAMDRLSNARSKVHVLKSTLDSVTGGFVYPFHDIDAAHGTLKYQMIPLAREHQALTEKVNQLTAERDKLKSENLKMFEDLCEVEGQRDSLRDAVQSRHKQCRDLTHTNQALQAANDEAMRKIGKLETQTPSPITVRAKDEMWGILNVDNQTDALQRLRMWKQMVEQRHRMLTKLGVDSGYDAYQIINRLRNFLHALSERKGEKVTKPQMDEYVLIATKLIYALNRRSSEG